MLGAIPETRDERVRRATPGHRRRGSRTNSSGTRKLALSTSSRLSGRCRDVAIATALATVEIARRPERVRTLWALSAMSGGSPLLVHASSSALSIAPQGARVHCVVNGNPGAVTAAAAATVVPTMSTASRKNVDPRASIHRRREPCGRRTRGSVDSARWGCHAQNPRHEHPLGSGRTNHLRRSGRPRGRMVARRAPRRQLSASEYGATPRRRRSPHTPVDTTCERRQRRSQKRRHFPAPAVEQRRQHDEYSDPPEQRHCRSPDR